MEKIIKLTMEPSKEIVVSVNGKIKLKIDEQRSINANDIFSLLEFSLGDHYTVESENPDKKDEAVLHFFTELISDVTKQLNDFSIENEEVSKLEKQMDAIVSEEQEKEEFDV